MAFARFADAAGHEGPLASAIVLRWVKEQAVCADPFTWAQRLNVLRPFARHLADAESGTSFPEGAPSLTRATAFRVEGDYTFERDVAVVGDVTLESSGTERVSAGTVLTGSGDSSDSAG